jgi:catechol 2,3-dioxygenase-like lactoylglutathione lyase family enzyme
MALGDEPRRPFVALDHVQLAIPPGGEERARAFYVDVLGLEELPKPPELAARGGLWLKSGDVHLHLGVDRDFRSAKKAHPAFRCHDYGALVDKLQQHAIAVNEEDGGLDGVEHCYISDPFGNRIELIES